MNKGLKKVLEAGHAAPSGENAQPWCFKVLESSEPQIDVHIVPSRDQSLYAWKNRSAYVAAGAVIENMRHAAAAEGYSTKVDLSGTGQSDLSGSLILKKINAHEDPLAEAISKRATNRKAYEKRSLPPELKTIIEISEENVRVNLIEDSNAIARLATAASTAERVMLANQKMHEFFFTHINWTTADDEHSPTGFFIDTLELPPPARMGFKVLSKWSRAHFLNKYLSFNTVVAKQNAALYTLCSAIGIVSAAEESAESAVRSGILFERIWLETIRAHWWLQPLAGIIFLGLRVAREELGSLTKQDAVYIDEAYRTIKNEFRLENRVPYMMFRIGTGAPPSARSRRLPLEDVLST